MSRRPGNTPFVLRYVYAILAVVAISVAIVFTALQIAQQRDFETRNRVEYLHLDSVAELTELAREARTLHEFVRASLDPDATSQAGAAGVPLVQLGYGGVLESMLTRLFTLTRLEELNTDISFSLAVTRLNDSFRQIDHELRFSAPTPEIVTAIEVLSYRIEQLNRLHRIQADNLLNELAQRQRQRPGFIGFLVFCVGFGVLAIALLVRSLRSSLVLQARTEVALADSERQMHHMQKLEAVGGLAGGIAHDFNNWLTVILGHVGLLRDRVDNDQRVASSLDEIDQAARQAVSLTKQLLSFSRRQQFQPEVLGLNELIRGMEDMLRRVISADIKLTFSYVDDLYDVELDPDQTQQVILNLVNNARDAMPEGGLLSVTTGNVTVAAEDRGLTALPEGEYVQLSIADTGIGMDDLTRQRVFEPFFTTKDKGQGTGLGLSTVHGIIMASNGHINLESQKGEGTRFDLYFPRAERPKVSVPAQALDRDAQRGVETILVVEDNHQVLDFVATGLALLGYRVLTAAGGAAGLEICRSEPADIDLILSDVVMPGISGPQFLAAALEIRPDAAAIYMSAYAEDEVLRIRSEDSANDIPLLTKPFGIEDLSRLIREQLDSRTPSWASRLGARLRIN